MASENYAPLITLGPFKGLDTTSAELYVQPGYGVAMSNVDPWGKVGGLFPSKGRQNEAFVNTLPANIVAMAYYLPSTSGEQVLCASNLNDYQGTVLYDFFNGSQTAVQFGTGGPIRPGPWTQGVQMGNITYLNDGLQYSSQNGANVYYWQVPAPTLAQHYHVTIDVTLGTPIPIGTYYYAFTWVVVLPNAEIVESTGLHYGQETNPWGDVPIGLSPPTFRYTANVTGSGDAVQIEGIFSGTLDDGSTYYTRIYRQSANQPFWTLLVDLTDKPLQTVYIDNNTDLSIEGNPSLSDSRMAPPNVLLNFPGMAQPWPIEAHKNRMWMFTAVPNTTATDSPLQNITPQLQLWYSNYGRGWEFDATNQVLLVEDGDTPNFQDALNSELTYGGYGEWPVQLASMSSLLVVFKRRSFWIIIGDDQNTFVPLKVAQIGCISKTSVTKTPGAIYWLSEQGCYMYDGNSPQYISEKVRGLLDATPTAQLEGAVGMYKDLTWYLSFPGIDNPNQGFTLGYYIPSREWFSIPYSTPFALSTPGNPAIFEGVLQRGEILAARNHFIDSWFTDPFQDLTLNIVTQWTGPLTDSGYPQFQKTYDFITLEAPVQLNCHATVTLNIDPSSPTGYTSTYHFDLGSGETRHIARVTVPDGGGNTARGYLANLEVTASGQGASIYNVHCWGNPERAFTIPS